MRKFLQDIAEIRLLWIIPLMMMNFAAASVASVPVVSDIKIMGSDRGLAVAISADLAFEAKFEKTGNSTIKITTDNCIYGLNTFSIDNFKNDFPVERLNVKEDKNKIEIYITVNRNIQIQIESQKKNNQWIALLSRSKCISFKWSAAEYEVKSAKEPEVIPQSSINNNSGEDKNNVKKDELTQSMVPDNKMALTRAQQMPSLDRQADTVNDIPVEKVVKNKNARLINVHVMQRNKLCKLVLEFDTETESSIRRVKDTVYIEVVNGAIGLRNGKVSIPGGIPFSSIKIRDKKNKGINVLTVAVLLDKKSGALKNGLIVKKDRTITLFSSSTGEEKLTKWSSEKGYDFEQSFYSLPSYNVDMKEIGERAVKDAKIQTQPNDQVFSMQESELTNEKVGPGAFQNNKDSFQNVITPAAPTSAPLVTGSNDADMVKAGINNVDTANTPKISQPAETPPVAIIPPVDQSIVKLPDSETVKNDSAETDTLTKNVQYTKFGRDPFMPLTSDEAEMTDGINVEHLRLVGILLDNVEQMALFEDLKNNNKPFALRENDPVNKGKVLKIYKDKVVFLITEFGISRSYTIRLATKQAQEAQK